MKITNFWWGDCFCDFFFSLNLIELESQKNVHENEGLFEKKRNAFIKNDTKLKILCNTIKYQITKKCKAYVIL